MKLSVLETALDYLKLHVDDGYFDEIDEADIANCFIELAEMKQAAPFEDFCDDVTVIPAPLMIDFGNRMWYDTYGRTARRLGYENMIPGNFINTIRQEECCTEVSSLVLSDIFDFLHDLWHDNELTGDNNPDGTFKRPVDESLEKLREALVLVQDHSDVHDDKLQTLIKDCFLELNKIC